MLEKAEYELIDFGAGRRLERFKDLILDRPCPTALGIRQGAQNQWKEADAIFVERKRESKNSPKATTSSFGFRGYWRPITTRGVHYFPEIAENSACDNATEPMQATQSWELAVGGLFLLELKGSPFGHLGVFPEQSSNWRRIYDLCCEGREKLGRPLRVLNLFGYTGGSALAALAARAETTHLDAARNIVAQAKRNASLSFPEAAANGDGIVARWIVDDAVKFVKRELKRESRYDAIILDPPTYGHGARGEVWRLARDLEPLLANCARALNDSFSFIMLTGHTQGFEAHVLERMLRSSLSARFGASAAKGEYLSQPLGIRSKFNGVLPCGDLALAVLR